MGIHDHGNDPDISLDLVGKFSNEDLLNVTNPYKERLKAYISMEVYSNTGIDFESFRNLDRFQQSIILDTCKEISDMKSKTDNTEELTSELNKIKNDANKK